jgi:hypothetical protein
MPTDESRSKPATHEPDPSRTPSPADPAHAVEPSGYQGNNPATAGLGPTQVNSNTPENASGHLNPSAPEDANTTPGSTGDK